jgi:hypothetical protein
MEFEWDKGKAELNLKKVNPDELRPEYNRDDLGRGIRGKHYDDYKSGTNLVLLCYSAQMLQQCFLMKMLLIIRSETLSS